MYALKVKTSLYSNIWKPDAVNIIPCMYNDYYDHDYDYLLGTDSIHADITQGYPGLQIQR